MTFSRDINHERLRMPRTLNEAFGPGSKLTVEPDSNAKLWVYAIATGLVIGFIWWLGVALRAGA